MIRYSVKGKKGRKVAAFLGVTALSVALLAMPVMAKGTGTVTGTGVNVRKSAGTAAEKVTTVTTGDQLRVTGSKKDSTGKKWYKVTFTQNGTNYTGYIISNYVNYKKDAATPDQATADQAAAAQTDGSTTVLDVSGIAKDIKQNTTNQTNTGNTQNNNAGTTNQTTAAKKTGAIQGDYVRIRKKPVAGTVVCQLMKNTDVTVKGSKKGSDGYIWYKISFKYGGKKKTGYVRSDLLKVNETKQEKAADPAQSGAEPANTNGTDQSTVTSLTDAEFESYLTAQGFPESYKQPLRQLHTAHPEWTFKAVQTNLAWNDVVAAESAVGKNLVSKNAIVSWKSLESTAYNRKKNTWYGFDGGSWVAASTALVQYYLDPRNFLGETSVFQFESLEYEDYQNVEGLKALLAGSFMNGDYTEPDGSVRNYADAFIEIGRQVGVSPYHLAARCYQEQGKGKSDSIKGTVEGFESIFNYYNIGAYASGGNSPTRQGLIYASGQTSGANNYERPWNTRYKSLLGGAEYVAQKYVKVKQNTLYFQKFNVVNTKNGLYKHQYMTNVQAAASEAQKMSKACQAGDRLVFYIPVYTGMPETACVKPTDNKNPNNYLATLAVTDQELTPVFDPETEYYDLTVKKKVKTAEITATAVAASSEISGTGTYDLERGENVFTITCTAQTGEVKTYTIHIIRK